jgi:choice-of-anchor B domain-containing protein
MPRRQSLPRFALVLLVALLGTGAFVGLAVGSDPGEGTITLEERQATWTGKSFTAGAAPSRSICNLSSELCDSFTLHADIPASHWETSTGGAEVVIAWEDPEDDFDLYVLDSEDKVVASSAVGGTDSERVMIEDASGTYKIVVNPYSVTDSGYSGGVLLESREDVAPGASDVPTEPVSNLDCTGGKAGPFPCSGVDLDGFLPNAVLNDGAAEDDMGDPVELNDIWGWTDPQTGREYALVGKTNGTAFVDITQADAPRYLGSLPTAAPVLTLFKTWRDIKVHDDHAFIVSEEPTHGMQVFDLTRLRGVTEPREWDEDAHYDGFGSAHNIAINEDSGFAYSIGTRTCAGGSHIVDIRDPKAPKPAGCVAQDGYTHDTQCVNYDGPDERFAGREICFDSNEDSVTIVDVTDKLLPKQLSRTEYAGAQYTHQGWLTEDGRHFLVNDELDEQETGEPTTTRVFDVSKLDQPVLKGTYRAKVGSIDHNLYTKGDVVYEANYRSGLRVLDARGVGDGELKELGFFDVYPADDEAEFNGSWSNYPYFASGKVIVSGIEQGLFVLDPSAAEAPVTGDGGQTTPGTGTETGPAGGATGASGGTTTTVGGATAGVQAQAARASLVRRSLRASRTRRVAVRVRCAGTAGTRCLGRLALRRAGRAIGARSYAIRAGRTATVRVRLRPAAYRALTRRGALRARLVLSPQGSAPEQRTVRLRAPRR